MNIWLVYKFSHSEDSLLSSLQNTTSASNLIMVTLEAMHHVWYLLSRSDLFHHMLCRGTRTRPSVAKWQSNHHGIVQELIETCPFWELEQEYSLKVMQQEPREKAVFIFGHLISQRGKREKQGSWLQAKGPLLASLCRGGVHWQRTR